jgi:hypothetical protein
MNKIVWTKQLEELQYVVAAGKPYKCKTWLVNAEGKRTLIANAPVRVLRNFKLLSGKDGCSTEAVIYDGIAFVREIGIGIFFNELYVAAIIN